MWFNDSYYDEKGAFIKWNPAVKKESDQSALKKGLLSNHLDIIATDHAPHTLQEKNNDTYSSTPSGGPMVQHALPVMLEMVSAGEFTIEQVVEKMAHAPAICFQVENRGFIREGYYADLVLVNTNQPWQVNRENLLYKCGWSPLEGSILKNKVEKTIVNGMLVYDRGQFNTSPSAAMRLNFNRQY